MNYGTLYEYFIDKSSPAYKAPINQLYNTAKRLKIDGRSKMNKAQLERAVERARR